MEIVKIINNNIVSALDDENKEIVVMGKGLGFHTKAGQKIPEERIEKIFRLNDESEIGKFKELLEAMPLEHIQTSVEIIDYAKSVLKRRINQNIYITLTDHINFAIQRQAQGIQLKNALLWEIKKFYHQEYLMGKYAIDLLKDLGIEFKTDEAASIALHIVNAEYDSDMSDTMRITTTIREVLSIIENFFEMKLDEESLHYSRLVTHLKFLVQRIFSNQMLDDGETELSLMIQKMYPHEYECSKKVVDYIKNKYQNYTISQDEMTYLAVHIRRIYIELHKLEESKQ